MRLIASLISGPRSVLALAGLAAEGAEVVLLSTHGAQLPLAREVLPEVHEERLLTREALRESPLDDLGGPPVGDEVGESSALALAGLGMLDRANWNGASYADLYRLYLRLVAQWRARVAAADADVCWFDGVPHQAQDWALYQTCREAGVVTVVTSHTVFDHSPVVYLDVSAAPIPVGEMVAGGGDSTSRYLSQVTSRLVDQAALGRSRGAGELLRGGLDRVRRVMLGGLEPIPGHYPAMIPSWPRRVLHRTALRMRDRARIARTAKRLLALPASLPDSLGPFVFFPLHFQPEMTSVPLGMPHFDQVSALRAIAAALGGAVPLLVKEHPQMLRWSSAWVRARSASFYQEIEALPGVRMVSPAMPSDELMRRAAVVGTLTGTPGYEARLRDATTVCFGAPWYQPLRGVHRARDGSALRSALERGLSSPEPPLAEDEIESFVATYTLKGAWARTPEGESEGYWPARYARSLHAVIADVLGR